jgi:GntR family transcriptional regulator
MLPELNPVSISNQVKASLLKYIEQLQLEDKDQLPSEITIAKALGVSRNTLREAYVELENSGVIIRKHGIGTFIAHSHVISDSLNEFSPFAQIIREGGFAPTFHTISIEQVTPPYEVSSTFSLANAKNVFLIKRIVQADQKPAIYIEDYINPDAHPETLDWDAFDGNLVSFLAASLKTTLHHIQSKIRATGLKQEYSNYLELECGTPVLSVRSVIHSKEQPIVYSKIYFNSKIVELNIVRMIGQ